jgi:hypothetical protein
MGVAKECRAIGGRRDDAGSESHADRRRVMHSFARRATAFAIPALIALGATIVQPTVAAAQKRAVVPWVSGELLEYEVRFGSITAGSGRISVVGHDTVRGRDTWRLRFNVTGGLRFIYRINDTFESYFDSEKLVALRFNQDLSEGNRDTKRLYEIYPDRKVFTKNGGEEMPSVSQPLDDASFLFFVRSIPLEVGKTYEFDRYYDPKSNPVIVKVLRRDTIDVPAGRFPTIVVQPIIKTSGIFSEGGKAELWLTDDKYHNLVQMKTRLSFGSLNLYLKKITIPGTGAGANSRASAESTAVPDTEHR